jgi:hypothetical protein
MYYLTAPVDQKSIHSISGCHCLTVSCEVVVILLAQAAVSSEVSVGDNCASKITQVVATRFHSLLVVDQTPLQFPAMQAPPHSSSQLTPIQLASLRMSE